MNRFINFLALLLLVFFTSCTVVIEVEVPSEEPRLVIEASINWEKETVGNNQRIKLSKSTPYFDTNGTEPGECNLGLYMVQICDIKFLIEQVLIYLLE